MSVLDRSSPRRRFVGRIGLLAGGGRFPLLFAQAAHRRGMEVVCVGIDGHADRKLARSVDTFSWNGIARLGSLISRFKRQKVDCVVMAGKIHKSAMYDRWRILKHMPDLRFLRVFLSHRRRDNRDDSLLNALVEEFERDGIHVASALEVCPELLASAGCLGKVTPKPHEIDDIAFGWKIARELGRLDIGQAVCVRERAILAVEAIEGTDRSIERAGELCPSGGFTVVKVSKPNQDARFDVPTVGVNTIETMYRAGGTCLAIEAGRTIVLDADETTKLADHFGIAFVALSGNAQDEAQFDPEKVNGEKPRRWERPSA